MCYKIDLIDDISTIKLPVQLLDQNYITISCFFDATGIQSYKNKRIVSLLNNHSRFQMEVKLNYYNQTEQLNWLIKPPLNTTSLI